MVSDIVMNIDNKKGSVAMCDKKTSFFFSFSKGGREDSLFGVSHWIGLDWTVISIVIIVTVIIMSHKRDIRVIGSYRI